MGIRNRGHGFVCCGRSCGTRGASSLWSPTWQSLIPSRHIINHNHKWYLYLVFAYLDASWAAYIISRAVYSASWGVYVLSFSQVCPLRYPVGSRIPIKSSLIACQILSLSATIPPLVSTIRFVYRSHSNLLQFARCLPNLAFAEAKYLILDRTPDVPAQDNHVPITHQNSPPPSTPQELFVHF